MPFPLIPLIIAGIGGLAVTGAGVAVIESRKSEREEIDKTTTKLEGEAQALMKAGTLYPAFRAFRKYVDYVKNNYQLSSEQRNGLERDFSELKQTALGTFQKLATDYRKEADEAKNDDSGDERYKVQVDYLAKLKLLLGDGAPHLKTVEDSFGINYQVHKHGIAIN